MEKREIRKFLAFFMTALLLLAHLQAAGADRPLRKKTPEYIGAMRVVWCKEWVSLREKPKKTANRLAEIPLDAIVYSCTDIGDERFYQCEYNGQTGYVLKGYLWPAPEFEPPLSSSTARKMTPEEVTGNGEKVLEWNDYNMSVIAAHEWTEEDGKRWEVLRIGCFINGKPIWGQEERAEECGQYDLLKTFIGGVTDDWQVMVYNGAYGLSMLDLLSGKERWCVRTIQCPLGNAAATAVDEEGNIYIAGTDGPDPVAISPEGEILWEADVNNPDIYDPYEITAENGMVFVKYRSGLENGYHQVTFDSKGRMISLREMSDGQ